MRTFQLGFAVIALTLWSASGCQKSDDNAVNPTTADDESHSEHSHDDHAHHDHTADHNHDTDHDHHGEGPHHGHLIELGNGKFHAELVHDDSTVTIHLLDESTKSAVAIEAPEVLVNLRHDGKAQQFKLTASPDTGDADGKSSRFTLQSEELAGHVDDATSEARISVMIEGTAYTGSLTHD